MIMVFIAEDIVSEDEIPELEKNLQNAQSKDWLSYISGKKIIEPQLEACLHWLGKLPQQEGFLPLHLHMLSEEVLERLLQSISSWETRIEKEGTEDQYCFIETDVSVVYWNQNEHEGSATIATGAGIDYEHALLSVLTLLMQNLVAKNGTYYLYNSLKACREPLPSQS